MSLSLRQTLEEKFQIGWCQQNSFICRSADYNLRCHARRSDRRGAGIAPIRCSRNDAGLYLEPDLHVGPLAWNANLAKRSGVFQRADVSGPGHMILGDVREHCAFLYIYTMDMDMNRRTFLQRFAYSVSAASLGLFCLKQIRSTSASPEEAPGKKGEFDCNSFGKGPISEGSGPITTFSYDCNARLVSVGDQTTTFEYSQT